MPIPTEYPGFFPPGSSPPASGTRARQGLPVPWPLLTYAALHQLGGELRILSITFICGTDSPVSMASSTMQRPRSSRTSHGTRFSCGERPARCRQESQQLAKVRTSAEGGILPHRWTRCPQEQCRRWQEASTSGCGKPGNIAEESVSTVSHGVHSGGQGYSPPVPPVPPVSCGACCPSSGSLTCSSSAAAPGKPQKPPAWTE